MEFDEQHVKDYEDLAELIRESDRLELEAGRSARGGLPAAAHITASDWWAERLAEAKAEALREAADAPFRSTFGVLSEENHD